MVARRPARSGAFFVALCRSQLHHGGVFVARRSRTSDLACRLCLTLLMALVLSVGVDKYCFFSCLNFFLQCSQFSPIFLYKCTHISHNYISQQNSIATQQVLKCSLPTLLWLAWNDLRAMKKTHSMHDAITAVTRLILAIITSRCYQVPILLQKCRQYISMPS